MKKLLYFILGIIILFFASIFGFGLYIYSKYINYANQYTICRNKIENLDINEFINSKKYKITPTTKTISVEVPYKYILDPAIKEVKNFDEQEIGAPSWLLTVLNKLEGAYKYVFKTKIKNKNVLGGQEFVCIKPVDNAKAEFFASKAWWLWLNADIKISSSKVILKKIVLDSFDISPDLLQLANARDFSFDNIVPAGVSVSFGKQGIIVKYSVQVLLNQR